MLKISTYTKTGETAATAYYRLYQYLKLITAEYHHHKMLADNVYEKVMPIYTKPIVVKVFIFIYVYIRVFYQLLSDIWWRPDIIIISRRLINRFCPISYKWMLWYLKYKGTKIIWDFDDNIIETREISRKSFSFFCSISDYIIVASPNNKNMIATEYQDKTIILPTTDGDMYKKFSNEISSWRKNRYCDEIILAWVGTSVSLEYVKKICPLVENAAVRLCHKKIILKVICNLPLKYKPKHFTLENIRWDRNIAIQELLHSHVGIMPLENNIKNQGKGGFKLIQYLSIGLPVIGSRVGINEDIIDKANGYLINDLKDDRWCTTIVKYASNLKEWESMSANATLKWNKTYSFEYNLKFWRQLIK